MTGRDRPEPRALEDPSGLTERDRTCQIAPCFMLWTLATTWSSSGRGVFFPVDKGPWLALPDRSGWLIVAPRWRC